MSGPDFEGVLYAHRQGALTCYDHPPTVDHPAWCCVCGDHGLMVSHRAHLSAALHAELARWLADEGTRDRVLNHVCPRASGPCPDCCETVPAALAALTATDQEDR